MKVEMTLSQKPFFAISFIVKNPDPKTMALGGVATGSIKAHEEAKQAASIGA